jgi:hypothetical protein
MPRILLLTALLFGLGITDLTSYAQTKPLPSRGEVRGVVLDAGTALPLREVSVSLVLARDSSYVTFSLTEGEGHYTLRGVRPGHYLLLFNSLGYQVVQQPVEMPADAASVEMPPQHLVAEARQLAEVIVTHERPPVSLHGDTVAFRANSFKTQPNAPVEQLLKKLPGVEVARDGSIRAQGKPVDNVLVDGKPFFGGDPKMATRNLPAAILDRVELFDKQDEQTALAGLDGGERQRTINLVTRRDKRRGIFGTEQAGVGTNGRYQARLGINRFNNNQQLSVLAQADNVNGQGYSDTGNPATGASGASQGGAGSLSSNSAGLVMAAPGGVRSVGFDNVNSPETGINASSSGGINYRDIWGSRIEVATSYLAAHAITLNDQLARRQNLTADATLPTSLTDQQNNSRVRTNTQRATLRLDYRLDTLTTLRLTPAINWQGTIQTRNEVQQTTRLGQLLNQSDSFYEANANSLTGGGTALLLHKFQRPDRALSISGTLNLASQMGTARNRSTTTFQTTSPLRLNQQVNQRTPATDGLLSISYAEPLSLRHKLEAHYSYAIAPSAARRLTTDFDSIRDTYSLNNALLSNEFSSRFNAHRAGLTWQSRRLRYTYSMGLDGQLGNQHLDNKTTAVALHRSYLSLLPQASFSYTATGSRTLRLTYRTLFTAPAALLLQPVPDLSDPLNVQLGNPDLRPEYAHSLTGTYQHFDPSRSRHVLVLLTGNAIQHRLVSTTNFDTNGRRVTQPVNADGYYQASGYLALGQRLASPELNLNATTSASFTRSPSFVNGQSNFARSWNAGQTFSANLAYNDRVELSVQAGFTYQQAAYSLAAVPSTTFFTQMLSAEGYWRMAGRWVVTSDLYFTNNNGLTTGYNPHVLRWNIGLAYQLFANRQGELKLYAFDVLNQNRSVIRTTTDTYLEDVRSRVLTRYLQLSFTYQLRRFGK